MASRRFWVIDWEERGSDPRWWMESGSGNKERQREGGGLGADRELEEDMNEMIIAEANERCKLGGGKRPYPLFLSLSVSGRGQQEDKEAPISLPTFFVPTDIFLPTLVALLVYTRVLTTFYSSKWKWHAKITMTHILKISFFYYYEHVNLYVWVRRRELDILQPLDPSSLTILPLLQSYGLDS